MVQLLKFENGENNYIPYFTGHVITYPHWDSIKLMLLVKGAPDGQAAVKHNRSAMWWCFVDS